MAIEPRFYRKIAAAPFRRERRRSALALAGLLAAWQASSTAGFVWEWAVGRPRASRARSARRA